MDGLQAKNRIRECYLIHQNEVFKTRQKSEMHPFVIEHPQEYLSKPGFEEIGLLSEVKNEL